MEEVIEKTPQDILLMKDITDEHSGLVDLSEKRSSSEIEFIKGLEIISPVAQLSSLGDLTDLDEFSKTNQLGDLEELRATIKLEEYSKSSE